MSDVVYELDDGAAWITIDREERLNALTAGTVEKRPPDFRNPSVS